MRHIPYKPGEAHAAPTNSVATMLPVRYKSPGYTKDVEKFVLHPRNKRVTFYETGEHFIHKDPNGKIKTIRGLTKLMGTQFYPPTAKEVGRTKLRPVRKKKEKGKGPSTVIGVGGSWDDTVHMLIRDTRRRGKTLGTMVHEELSDYAKMNDVAWLDKHPTPNMYTIKAIRALAIWRLEPIAGECPILGDGFATGIDMVCTNSRGQLVLVEIKTGYEGAFELPSYVGAKLRYPLGGLRGGDCPRNKAMMQISIARSVLIKHYGLNNPLPLVVRIHKTGVDHHWADQYLIEHEVGVYRALTGKKRASLVPITAPSRTVQRARKRKTIRRAPAQVNKRSAHRPTTVKRKR